MKAVVSPRYIRIAGGFRPGECPPRLDFWDMAASGKVGGFEVLDARSGASTLVYRRTGRSPVFLHSKYDPENEAEQFAEANGILYGDSVVAYGLGLGYHLKSILRRVGFGGRLTALEACSEVISLAWSVGVLRELLSMPNFTLCICPSPAALVVALADELQEPTRKLVIHSPSLCALPAEYDSVRNLLREWKVAADSRHGLSALMEENLAANREVCASVPGVEVLFDRFKGVPLILVGAGPSLDDALAHLKAVEERALLFAVGTALRPLLRHGLESHLAIIVDPQPIVARQLEGATGFCPLIFLPTASKEAVAAYPGLKLAAFQVGHPQVEELARGLGRPLIETGGSVATAALDIAIRMGANPIILVGQDLAYVNGNSHAHGTIHGELGGPLRIFTKVPGNNGEEVESAVSWNICRRWIERRIAREKGRINFINTSLVGARIEGTQVVPVDQVIQRFCRSRLDVRSIMTSILSCTSV